MCSTIHQPQSGLGLSHDQLVRRALVVLRRHRCVLYDTKINATSVDATSEVPDAIGWTCRGHSIVIECRTSRSEFLADATKPARGPLLGMGRQRIYVAPKGVISPDELAHGWGLVVTEGRRTLPVVPPQIRDEWDRHAELLALLHLARRACDQDRSGL